MFNMPYPFVPDPNLFGGNYNNKITDLEQQINRLNREFRRLEHRVKLLKTIINNLMFRLVKIIITKMMMVCIWYRTLIGVLFIFLWYNKFRMEGVRL